MHQHTESRSSLTTALFRPWASVALATLLLVLFTVPVRAVEVNPAHVNFTTITTRVKIAVTHNGMPVAASDVKSVKLYVADYDYDHMISVTKSDGQISIVPTEMLEQGNYDLVIKTVHGEGRVAVESLTAIADSGLEARAQRQGVSVEEIKAQLGISQPLGRERIDLDFTGTYYLGQKIEQHIAVAEGRRAVWMVNGVEVPTADGKFSYTVDPVGIYDIAYLEKEAERVVALGLGTVVVVKEPRVLAEASAGSTTRFTAPAGYGKYAWTVDGNAVDGGATWSGSFDTAGDHELMVRCTDPAQETSQALRVTTYLVKVS
tara:strand:+ start:854 stop:1807 length:954 start_codon:yes stop_codon:yes gene_type:complete